MGNVSKCLILTALSVLVSACQTTQTTTTVNEDKKITAAKINDQLGIAYLQRNDLQRAKQKFLLALDEAPGIPETWYSMAYFLESTGNQTQAKEHYLKAVALAPTRGDVLNNYGTYLCRNGDYQGAVNNFIKATEDTKYLDQAGAYENAGLCAAKIPNSKSAQIYFDRALAEDPKRPTSLIELAELNFKQGDYDSAKNRLTQFLEISAPTVQSYLLEKNIDEKMKA